MVDGELVDVWLSVAADEPPPPEEAVVEEPDGPETPDCVDEPPPGVAGPWVEDPLV